MLFTKTKLYKKYKYPIDGYKTLKDGNRIFGDNKTYIGFVSMVIFTTLFQIIMGFICNHFNLIECHDLYRTNENTISFNILFGFLTGFIYMISELPNSFIKRRFNIQPGKTKNILSFLVDQFDSIIGVMLLLYIFSDISFIKYIIYVLVGGFTHVAINLVLYLTKVRKNIWNY